MKKGIRILCSILILLLIIGVTAAGLIGRSDSGLEFAEKLANGINLGNTLDSTDMWDYNPDRMELEYEIFWGNPVITPMQLKAIHEAGFKSVRIPVTWDDHIDESGIISEIWMQRVIDVVDIALAEDLYVVLDTHHEEWLNLEVEREEEICEMYQTVWTQIAECFIDYDQRLIFEGMNEPRLRNSVHEWDAGTPELRAMVNHLNETFVNTVRATGGKNEDRYLMICAYATNTETASLEDLVVPEGNIIVAVHIYTPYFFCLDEWGTAEWSASNSADTQPIEKAFAEVKRLFIDNGIPVAITEFGCLNKSNASTREEWIRYYTKLAADNGIPCFWWDNGSNFKLLDRNNGTWTYPGLVDAIVGK